MTATAIHHGPTRLERLSADDFETASVRSAAPSYISEAPSYHSTLPPHESAPAYTPATAPAYTTQPQQTSSSTPTPRQSSTMLPPAAAPMSSTFTPGAGLPRLPSPRRRASELPQLSQFRLPTSWASSSSGNPQARHYQSVANRRAAAAVAHAASTQSLLIAARDDVVNAASTADDDGRVRPLEDPYLVGEVAAARARRERLARQNGDDILIREDMRWDWFLSQMNDAQERERSWANFRQSYESRGRSKLARRFWR
ncbi:Uu.00g116600.m01.CDS01 [Anthostomella pinea]|uniref:Uu.00g116600.m01.CDS01 n=1 Tax=Anthostomella pinea TaxID=933095 RepID=A0AAI8VGK5_9PEZI|nr:Uu.00g116600.m01.CDS01 [Anthostomella pinea]